MRDGRCAAGDRFTSGPETGLGNGTSQSGHAHSVWKISSSLTLRGVSSVVPGENGGTRVSISVCSVVSSIDNERWCPTMDRNGGPSC